MHEPHVDAGSTGIAGDSDKAQVRMVTRHLSEFLLRRAVRWQQAFATGPLDPILLQVTLSGNLAHLPVRHGAQDIAHGLHVPDARRRPVSMLAVANSMHISYETVRRRAGALRGAGLLIAADGGYVTPSAALDDDRGRRLIAEDAQALRDFVAVLHAQGTTLLPPTWSTPTVADDLAARMLLDFAIRALANFTRMYGGFTSGLIRVAIVTANVRHLLEDVSASHRYAAEHAVPPDGERRPVTLRTLAHDVALPYETVRRHVAALRGQGVVKPCGDGFIVPAHVLMDDRQLHHNRSVTVQLKRLLEDLGGH